MAAAAWWGLSLAPPAAAQEAVATSPPVPATSAARPTTFPADLPPTTTTPTTTAPTTPSSALPPVVADLGTAGQRIDQQDRLVVRRFEFEGNTQYDGVALRRVVAPYADRPVSVEQLEDARLALTRFYVEAGYINSGAVLPDQTIADPANATVTYRIVEGRLGDIRLTGNARLRDRYLLTRLRRAAGPPLNLVRLKDQLELFRQDPNIATVNAELRPGTDPGDAGLDVRVAEANPWQLGVVVSNRRPPSVGSTAVDLFASHSNLTGNGDLLSLRYDVANGPLDDLEYADLDDFSVDYAIPVSPSDATLAVTFSRTDSVVVETPFEDLDIRSKSNSVAAVVRQPVYRRPVAEPGRPAVEVALFAGANVRDNETTLLGERFEFSRGANDGRTLVFAVRLGQEFSARGQDDAASVRSTFSVGLPVFGATENGRDALGDLPDGQFVSWLGQAQYVRRLGGTAFGGDVQLVLRGAAQLSNSPLPSTEQFAVGGADTVRGYRENTLVRDQGVAGSVELRVPVIRKGGDTVLTVVPFADAGYGKDLTGDAAARDGDALASVGAGLVFAPDPRVSAQLFYGYALVTRSDSRRDPQDVGLHFSLSVYAFKR